MLQLVTPRTLILLRSWHESEIDLSSDLVLGCLDNLVVVTDDDGLLLDAAASHLPSLHTLPEPQYEPSRAGWYEMHPPVLETQNS